MDSTSAVQMFAQGLSEFILKTKYHCQKCQTVFEYSRFKDKRDNPRCPKCEASGGDIIQPEITRSYIRNIIFRIRDKQLNNNDRFETNKDIKNAEIVSQLVSAQFHNVYIHGQGMVKIDWNNFTFLWDIGVLNTIQVIEKEMWSDAGGGWDERTGHRSPPAFTNQE